jgi:phytoene synthase
MADATVKAGRAAIAQGSQSFAAAARLFDRDTRASAVMLYAWCRHCDDVIDGQDFGHASAKEAPGTPVERLGVLEAQTRAVLDGKASSEPAFAGLARVVARHEIPAHLPLAHLDGYRMDVAGRRYETLEDLLDYCYGVAGVVGIMMAYIMGVREPVILDRACDLGLAFQLTNIARDIVPDARQGRVYLPRAWLDGERLSPDALTDPASRAALATLAARLIDTAEPYYASALDGVAELSARHAWAIATARLVYRAIGLEVVRRGPHAWDSRVSTSTSQKLGFVAAGGFQALRRKTLPITGRRWLWNRPA